jgi:replication factor A1
MEKSVTKVKDLTPNSKQVNVLAKVLSVGEAKEVMGKFGDARRVAEATVADDTGQIILSLWNEQIGSVAKDDTILVDNGYVSLVRGRMRLNVGRYGTLSKSTETVEPNTQLDMSAQEYDSPRRSFSGGYGRDRDGPRSDGPRREGGHGGFRRF